MNKVKGMYISFKGVRNDEVGAKLIDMPVRTSPAALGEIVEVPGMSGAMWMPFGSYGSITVKANFAIMKSTDERAVLEWLDGSGDLILGDMPEYCFKWARVTGSGTLRNITPRLEGKTISVTWTCHPFRMLVNEQALSFTPSGAELEDDYYQTWFPGAGSAYARPEITIEVSGDDASITLMVNGWTLMFEHINGSVTIDCDAMLCLTNGVNVSRRMTIITDEDDEWPRLYGQGETNLISWLASDPVTSVTVKPRWRWL